ncbi:MAG: hypothetical protein QOG73_4558, partial [Acetobacteraceae bacterium]|nr:hypothetical protein [Acetobacteraceae bacterium]
GQVAGSRKLTLLAPRPVSTDTQENVSSLICKNGAKENVSATRHRKQDCSGRQNARDAGMSEQTSAMAFETPERASLAHAMRKHGLELVTEFRPGTGRRRRVDVDQCAQDGAVPLCMVTQGERWQSARRTVRGSPRLHRQPTSR